MLTCCQESGLEGKTCGRKKKGKENEMRNKQNKNSQIGEWDDGEWISSHKFKNGGNESRINTKPQRS